MDGAHRPLHFALGRRRWVYGNDGHVFLQVWGGAGWIATMDHSVKRNSQVTVCCARFQIS